MKRALLIAAVDPTIGGVMIFGDRGAGKSTAIRALAALLPPIDVVDGCPFRCDPKSAAAMCANTCTRKVEAVKSVSTSALVVDLPLGATEDRVVGALDIDRALTRGEKAFEPGLLAKAHRGFLYIDEVNLLEDHLVDLLLDVAASGENIVEREGLSVRHQSRFVLVGSGNPEEGELRPQLLDRFGLSVAVSTPKDIASRVEVVKRRDAFERDSGAFVETWRKADQQLALRLIKARDRVTKVAVDDASIETIARICQAVGSDGLRGELTILRAARALAALEAAKTVQDHHIRDVVAMALRHRLRRDPLEEMGADVRIERALAQVLSL